jgi:hypothetical protein
VVASLAMIGFGNTHVALGSRRISPAFLVAAFAFVAFCVAGEASGRSLAITGLPSADSPTITYRKIFKSSYPEFVEIKLNEAGHGTFDVRQLDEAANPQPFEVSAALSVKIFALAAKLHNFQGVDLDVHRRIANLGEKTFRYDKGSENHEVKFNYTLDDSAGQLTVIFEGLSRQATDLSDLERTMRYDRLGVNDVLLQIEQDYNNKLFPEPERLLPALDQLAADDKFIDIARQRARSLASRIRGSHSPLS